MAAKVGRLHSGAAVVVAQVRLARMQQTALAAMVAQAPRQALQGLRLHAQAAAVVAVTALAVQAVLVAAATAAAETLTVAAQQLTLARAVVAHHGRQVCLEHPLAALAVLALLSLAPRLPQRLQLARQSPRPLAVGMFTNSAQAAV